MTEGISKGRLIELKDAINDKFETGTPTHSVYSLILNHLISECKELSPWLAIDEFKNSGFVGLCWILTKDGNVFAHNFDGEYFINPYMPNYPIHDETVRSVMPIKTPEAPK